MHTIKAWSDACAKLFCTILCPIMFKSLICKYKETDSNLQALGNITWYSSKKRWILILCKHYNHANSQKCISVLYHGIKQAKICWTFFYFNFINSFILIFNSNNNLYLMQYFKTNVIQFLYERTNYFNKIHEIEQLEHFSFVVHNTTARDPHRSIKSVRKF